MYIPFWIIIIIALFVLFFTKFGKKLLTLLMALILYALVPLWLYFIYLLITDFSKFYLYGIIIIPIIFFFLIELVDNLSWSLFEKNKED
jgi:hypothetical protein